MVKLPDFLTNLSGNNKLLIATAIAFVIIQLIFFPGMFVSIDEHTYVKNSFLIQGGSIAVEDSGYACRSNLFSDQGYIASQFIGKSIFLIPFTWFGLIGVMFSGLIIHLINFFLIILLLKRFSVNPLYSVLYLFYPAFLWASRTLFAELLVLTGLLAGLYFYTSKNTRDHFLSGLFFGLAVLVRYDAIFALIAFAVPAFLGDFKKGLKIMAGAAPIGLLILIFNSLAYGGAVETGYGSGAGMLSRLIAGVFDFDILIYAIILLLVYPILLASPFLLKKFPLKKEYSLLILFYFILNATFTEFLAFEFSLESSIVPRLRYLIPLIGLLIIPYSIFLSGIADSLKNKLGFFEKHKPIFIGFILLTLFSGALLLSSTHSALVDSRKEVLSTIYENTPIGSTIIGSSDDCIYFQKNLFGDRKYYNINLKQQLAGNPENISVDSLKGNGTYILEVFYGNRIGRESLREQTNLSERQMLVDFIIAHESELDLVYENLENGTIRIYRWLG